MGDTTRGGPTTTASRQAEGGRLAALDGLRGLAALVVVVHHALLTWPVLAAQYSVANRASSSWWLTFTPLHLAWAGTEAVMVFFVLSGLVLALPFLRGTGGLARWTGYYGRRVVRLYVPVVVSLGLAAVLVSVFPRVAGPTTSWWFNLHSVPLDGGTLAADAVLLGGVSWIHPSLWSLRYEVLFSLLLPVYVLVARRLAHRPLLLLAGLLVASGVGAYVDDAVLLWLPVFGVGVTMAVCRERLTALGRRIADLRHATAVWWLLAGVAVVLLLAEWWSRGLHLHTVQSLAVERPVAVAGAAVLCFLALACPAMTALCVWRPVRWLGTVSFSLYLVHEPIVVSLSSLVGGSKRGVAITLVFGVLASLVVAAVFHRLVEAPSQRLARAVGRRCSGRPMRDAVTVAVTPVHSAAATHGAATHVLARSSGTPYPPRLRPAGAPTVPAQRVDPSLEWAGR